LTAVTVSHFVIRFDVDAGPPQIIVDDPPQYGSLTVDGGTNA